ncbi:hypothetical protein J1614_004029 [Plenodomus biglobosus]|nr:hypothetical protein J1614_004029 [Plenodomus biglobosus]
MHLLLYFAPPSSQLPHRNFHIATSTSQLPHSNFLISLGGSLQPVQSTTPQTPFHAFSIQPATTMSAEVRSLRCFERAYRTRLMNMQWDEDLIAAGEEPRYVPKLMKRRGRLAPKPEQESSKLKQVEPALTSGPPVLPAAQETTFEESDMEVEQPGRFLRSTDIKASPVKRNVPKKVKKTISAASVFKRSERKANPIDATYPEELQLVDEFVQAASAAKSMSSVRSPQKAEKRIARKRKRSDMHPLTVAFKDSSDAYRRNLYETNAQKINKTLESLLHRLHESTLQTIDSHGDQEDLQASPLKLTAPAKYERVATKLYQPLSQYKLTLYANNRQGERVRLEATLATRMQDYEDHLARRTEELTRLQKQWEVIVGEIWKLGVSCLDQDTMQHLLLTKDSAQLAGDFPSDTTKAESTLFVPEHDSSSPVRGEKPGKKRVTFETPDFHEEATNNLAFLVQPSRYKDTLPLAPPLPEQEVQTLTKEVKELGKKDMEELHKIGKEKQQFWKKKTNQIMQSLVEK